MNNLEYMTKMCEVCEIMAGIIDELYSLLSQHLEGRDAASLPVVKKIAEVTAVREELEHKRRRINGV